MPDSSIYSYCRIEHGIVLTALALAVLATVEVKPTERPAPEQGGGLSAEQQAPADGEGGWPAQYALYLQPCV